MTFRFGVNFYFEKQGNIARSLPRGAAMGGNGIRNVSKEMLMLENVLIELEKVGLKRSPCLEASVK